ncbi:hypothetical protein LXA47_21805 [Massilia sp. P8910]|uniref:DUF7684 family protein n=1 Tax=Massilia antarctica TaxID=2765360 RepID=UPI001E47078C|nr:hypothetical protein [Massilia antarctica]MCE3606221.1 hypothetical protein [Massilia antarctica]
MSHPVTYIHLGPGATPTGRVRRVPYKMVVIADAAVSPEWQSQVSDWIVKSGCRYMIAWGVDCSSWDDAVDMANIEAFDFGDIPDQHFIPTAWHADDPIEDVFGFCKHDAAHPVVELTQTVLLHIADAADEDALLQAYAAA